LISEIFLSENFLHAMVGKLIEFESITINTNLYILLAIIAIYSITFPFVSGFNVELFSKDESPFGISYSDWVAKYWNWDYSIPTDPQTNTFAGLKDNGCLVHKENSTVMLADTAAGGVWNQKCTISQKEGILIPIWTGECNQGAGKQFESYSFKQLSDCARGFDLGKVKGQVKVNNIPIAMLDAVDYKTNVMNNVTEIYTEEYNVTAPEDTHAPMERFGTFPAAAHGWFVFLKPLQPGNHTVYYQNSVEPTTLSGAGNVNSAQFTYHFNVQ
jgi:hypothetical protein